jgi:hypothetical protein
MGGFGDDLLNLFNAGVSDAEKLLDPRKALAAAVGLVDLPPGMWEMAMMLGPVTALEVLPALWWTLMDLGAGFDILLSVMNLLTFGHVEAVRRAVDSMWRPTWSVAQQLEEPTRFLAQDQLARVEKLHSDFTQLVQAGAGDTFVTAQKDADLLYQSMKKLIGDMQTSARIHDALYNNLHNVIPRAAGFAVGALDILADILLIIAATLATDGADLAAEGAVVATDPPAAVAILRTLSRAIGLFDTPVIEAAAFVAAQEAIGIWEVQVNGQLRDHPSGEAIVEGDITVIGSGSLAKLLDPAVQNGLEKGGCGAQMNAFCQELGVGIVEDIYYANPDYACPLLKSLVMAYSGLIPGATGGLSQIEAYLRTRGSNFYIGAAFEVQCLAQGVPPANIVNAVEPVRDNGLPGADASLKDGTLVDFKSAANLQSNASNWIGQIRNYRRDYPGKPLEYIFNGDKIIGPNADTIYMDADGNPTEALRQFIKKLQDAASAPTQGVDGNLLQPTTITLQFVFDSGIAETPTMRHFMAELNGIPGVSATTVPHLADI